MERMPWFKWWDGTAADPKLRMIAEECDVSVAVVLGVWAYLLEKASNNEDRGYTGSIERKLMNYTLKLSDETVETVCNGFKQAGLVTADDYINKWDDRQAKRENQEPPGSSTERVRALRERRKAAAAAALKESNGGNEQSNEVTDETTSNDTKRPKRKKKEEEVEVDKDKEEKTKAASPSALPDWLPLEAWGGYLEMRKKRNKVPTARAVQLVLNQLDTLRGTGQDVAAVLDKSTAMGWVDVYPIREERRGAARTAGAGSDKFQVAGLDHSSTRTAMEESMARHGITVPDNDDEIEI